MSSIFRCTQQHGGGGSQTLERLRMLYSDAKMESESERPRMVLMSLFDYDDSPPGELFAFILHLS